MPLLIATAPFGLLFGAVAAEKGLSTIELITMSAFIFAGASQFVALDLWDYPMAYGSIILAVFAVNFRHVLYSASLGRKMQNFNALQKAAAFALMVDPQWAAAEERAETHQEKGPDCARRFILHWQSRFTSGGCLIPGWAVYLVR